MSRTIYVNGEWVAEEEAKVSVFDRGFLFADAIYEVTAVLGGRLVEFDGHMNRLARSLDELSMPRPLNDDELLAIHREIVSRNALEEGVVYLQMTRGGADRDFVYPSTARPTVVLFTQAKKLVANPLAERGLRVVSMPDLRWARRDIKTVQLLAASMAKTAAEAVGADDAWLVEDGYVTEATSSNAHIVTKEGKIVTRALSNRILHGITRAAVLRFARETDMDVEERHFTIKEAQSAAEAFATSAGSFVMPVVEIDGVAIGKGIPGRVTLRLREIYLEESQRVAI